MKDKPTEKYVSKKELAIAYDININTLRNWVTNNTLFQNDLVAIGFKDLKKMRVLPPKIVLLIYQHFGEP